MAKKQKPEMNLVKLVEDFRSEDACRKYLETLRWPDGVVCPECGSRSVAKLEKRYQYDCNGCRYQFSVTAGTAFHNTHLPLWKWFATAYLMIESKKGISANQIKRTIGVSYKTAWYLCHRIRHAMKQDLVKLLTGVVEVDETYVGGKTRGKGRRYTGNKSLVLGAVEREGEAILVVGERPNRQTLHGFIHSNTSPDAETIMTDDWPAYDGIEDENTTHETVKHSTNEWVRGNVHTNTIEGVWSLLKRSIIGSYHKVSEKHLDAYLDELEWRYNNRKNPYLFRDTMLKMVYSGHMTYEKLTSDK